jgi:hypothetical protein
VASESVLLLLLLLLLPAPLISLHSYRASLHKGTSDASRLTNTKSWHFSILIFPLKLYTYYPVNQQSTVINFNYSPRPLHLLVEAVRLSKVIYPEEYLNSMSTERAG